MVILTLFENVYIRPENFSMEILFAFQRNAIYNQMQIHGYHNSLCEQVLG
jgi:hypothetical protein